jgi:hypothetical protein
VGGRSSEGRCELALGGGISVKTGVSRAGSDCGSFRRPPCFVDCYSVLCWVSGCPVVITTPGPTMCTPRLITTLTIRLIPTITARAITTVLRASMAAIAITTGADMRLVITAVDIAMATTNHRVNR